MSDPRRVLKLLGYTDPQIERMLNQGQLEGVKPRTTSQSLEVNQRWTNRADYYRHEGDGGPNWTDVRDQYGFEVVRKGRSKLDDFIIRNHYQDSTGPKGVTLPVAMYRKAGPAAKTTLAGVAYFSFPPAPAFQTQLREGRPTRYFGYWETGGYVLDRAYVKQLIRSGMRPTQAASKARREKRFERGPEGLVLREDHLKFGEVLELTRFVLLDSVPYGGETPFLAECFRFLRQLETHTDWMRRNKTGPRKIRCILSHSDPVPVRLHATGKLILPGHIGNIYQAHNAHYVGRSSTGIRHLLPSGAMYDGQNLGKVARGPGIQGFDYSYAALVEGGISPKRSGENWSGYVRRLKSEELTSRRHPGNLVYAWAIGSSKQKRQIEKGFIKAVDAENRPIYPKRPRQQYLNMWRRYRRAFSRGNFNGSNPQTEYTETIAKAMGQLWPKLNRANREGLSPPPLAKGAKGSVSRGRTRPGLTLGQLYQQSGLRPELDPYGER